VGDVSKVWLSVLLLAAAVIGGAWLISSQLEALANRPSEFAECAKFAAELVEREDLQASGAAGTIEAYASAATRAGALGDTANAQAFGRVVRLLDAGVSGMCTAHR
jgi:hypothetical protein